MIWFVLLGMSILAFICRYVKIWQGNRLDYAWFLMMSIAFVLLWYGLEPTVIKQDDTFPNEIAQQLSVKCEQQPVACILRARIDFAAEDYPSVLSHLYQAQKLGMALFDIEPLVQEMYLISLIHTKGLLAEVEQEIQSYLMVNDHAFRVTLISSNTCR